MIDLIGGFFAAVIVLFIFFPVLIVMLGSIISLFAVVVNRVLHIKIRHGKTF